MAVDSMIAANLLRRCSLLTTFGRNDAAWSLWPSAVAEWTNFLRLRAMKRSVGRRKRLPLIANPAYYRVLATAAATGASALASPADEMC